MGVSISGATIFLDRAKRFVLFFVGGDGLFETPDTSKNRFIVRRGDFFVFCKLLFIFVGDVCLVFSIE